METWKEFEANELTHSAAHHLLAIYELGGQYGGWARVSDIARQLAITRGSVSINMRTLKKRGLVEADEHHMVRLSPQGQNIVHGVMAKKAAMKAFLHHVLGVTEDQAEIDSCKIEHLISQATGERLLKFIRLLMSQQTLTEELLEKYRQYPAECPGADNCPVCEGHCLLEELKLAS